jgi:hypothetical protein
LPPANPTGFLEKAAMSDQHALHQATDFREDFGSAIWERPRIERAPPAFAQWADLVDRLPRLGTVLWTYRVQDDSVFPRARILSRGVLLLDHAALVAFVHCACIVAHAEVSAYGPREWLSFDDAHGICRARMHLLPDTDYLAWDSLIVECGIERVAALTTHARACEMQQHEAVGTWRARITRLPTLRLPCLQLLGLRAPAMLSALGREVALRITSAERALADS